MPQDSLGYYTGAPDVCPCEHECLCENGCKCATAGTCVHDPVEAAELHRLWRDE